MSEEGDINKHAKKGAYLSKLEGLLLEYPSVMILGADNVGSNQFQKIRAALRQQGQIVMGKNSMMRKAIRAAAVTKPELKALLPYIVNNIGLMFTKGDAAEVNNIVSNMTTPAAAKAGAIAPIDVTVPAGVTDLEPGQTAFLQVLGIATKITKSKIEILTDVQICTAEQKVGASEAALLQKLDIRPFKYGLKVLGMYDNGEIFSKEVLAITADSVVAKFLAGVANVAAVSLQINFPTAASAAHSIARGYKNVLAISIGTDYTFKGSEKVKAFLADPSAFAAAAPAASSAPAAAAAAPKKAEVKEASEDDDMGFSLFD